MGGIDVEVDRVPSGLKWKGLGLPLRFGYRTAKDTEKCRHGKQPASEALKLMGWMGHHNRSHENKRGQF